MTQRNQLCLLRVQNEQFSKEKGFIMRDTEKEVYFCRDSNPRSMDYWANSLPLSYDVLKIAATLTLATTVIFFVTRMLQQEGILSVLKYL